MARVIEMKQRREPRVSFMFHGAERDPERRMGLLVSGGSPFLVDDLYLGASPRDCVRAAVLNGFRFPCVKFENWGGYSIIHTAERLIEMFEDTRRGIR